MQLEELAPETVDNLLRKEASERERRKQYQRRPDRIAKHRLYQRKYLVQRRVARAALRKDLDALLKEGLDEDFALHLINTAQRVKHREERQYFRAA